jgi:hypothetical protein
MKKKHYGLISSIVILAALSAAAVYAAIFAGISANGERVRPFRSLPHINIPDPATMKKIERLGLEGRMTALAYPPVANPGPVNLHLFGYRPPRTHEIAPPIVEVDSPIGMNYSLTLAFSSNKRRFCVIDGSFYEEGADLPDGARIEKIEPNRVFVRKKDFTSWISLNTQGKFSGSEIKKPGARM